MKIQVCYVTSRKQWLKTISMPIGSLVINAVLSSGVLEEDPGLQLQDNVGIYSKKVPLTQILQDGDRVEIYQPLQLNPNQQRLLRAKNMAAQSKSKQPGKHYK